MRKTIGIDLGHGETSAAMPTLADADNKYKVNRLAVQDKDQVMATQIILTNEQMNKLAGHERPDYSLLSQLGEIQIGNDLPAYVPDGEKFCYFKAAPRDFNKQYGNTPCAKENKITHGMLMACFAYALVNNIFKYNDDALPENKRTHIRLLVGCPTTRDWTSLEAQSDYASLIEKATGVYDVRIIPESRAAMFSSIENAKSMVSASKGAIVFDFGSSTADCTYMLMGRKIIEFSWTLGASDIERQMTLTAYQEAVKQNGTFQASGISLANIDDNLRTAKEQYYKGKFPPTGQPFICEFQEFQNEADASIIDQQIRINDKFMQEITGTNVISIKRDSTTVIDGTWQKLCKAFFEDAKERISNTVYSSIDDSGNKKAQKCTIDTVVLTGGASRMDFIHELCKQVFPDCNVIRENNPSHAVSNGLCWVAVSDDNFITCCEAAKKELDENSNCSVLTLQKNVSDALFDKLSDIFENHTKIWAAKEGDDLTVRDLQNDIMAYLEKTETQAEIMQSCEYEINAWKDYLSANMLQSINNQVKKLYAENVAQSIVIPDDIWKELQQGELASSALDMAHVFENIDWGSIANKTIKGWISVIGWALAGGLAYFTGGLSVLIGSIADWIADTALNSTDLDKPWKQSSRKRIADKIKQVMKKEKSDIMKPFEEDFEKKTEGYSSMIEETLTKAFEIVTLKRFEN